MVVSSTPRPVDNDVDNSNTNGQEMNLSTSFDDDDVEFSHGFKPEITARYPLHDHEDNPLHDNITLFCHPSGSIQLKKDDHMPKVRQKQSKRFGPISLFAYVQKSLINKIFGFQRYTIS